MYVCMYVYSTVLQQHFAAIEKFLFHRTASLRRTALQLVCTLLRQGMICPLDVISAFIALQGDLYACMYVCMYKIFLFRCMYVCMYV
jgi:hypothetical protein